MNTDKTDQKGLLLNPSKPCLSEADLLVVALCLCC